MTQRMRTVSFKIPVEMDTELTAIARARGESRSSVVRTALGALMDPVGSTALDLVSDLVGIVDGPADLSSNGSYLEDLGE